MPQHMAQLQHCTINNDLRATLVCAAAAQCMLTYAMQTKMLSHRIAALLVK